MHTLLTPILSCLTDDYFLSLSLSFICRRERRGEQLLPPAGEAVRTALRIQLAQGGRPAYQEQEGILKEGGGQWR